MINSAVPNRGRWPMVIAAVAVVTVALVYLTQWLDMPLYPDEVAFRLLRARYLADGATIFGIVPCPGNAQTIPVVFRPAAYALAIADRDTAWSMVRLAPLAGILLALSATLLVLLSQGAVAASLMTTTAFVGVAGSGLLLSRGEAPMFFLGIACLAGYGLVIRSRISPLAIAVFLVLATWTALLAFFVHVQAVIYAPILIATAVALLIRTRHRVLWVLGALSIVLVLIGMAAGFSFKTECVAYPSVAQYLGKTELLGLARYDGLAGVQDYLWQKLPTYADQFLFKAGYPIDYLPGIEGTPYGEWLPWLNVGIVWAVRANVFLACVMTIVMGARTFARLPGKQPSQQRLYLVTGMPSLYLFLGFAGHLAILIDDVPTAFYRSFYIHVLLVFLNCLALSLFSGKRSTLLWPIGAAGVALSLGSALVSSSEMKSKFLDGWTGPSIRLQTDWKTVQGRVSKITQSCKINDSDSGIVVDDLTYDAVKQHRHLVPLTYTGFLTPPKPSDPAALYKLLHDLSATAIVTRCSVLPAYGLTPAFRAEEICCLKLPLAGAPIP